ITAVDAAGNSRTDTLAFTVDTTAPIATSQIDNSVLFQGKEFINSATPTLSGTSEPDSLIIIKMEDGSEHSISVDSAGNWSFITPTPLSEGDHQYDITAVDAAGNSQTETSLFVIDTIAPVTVANILDGTQNGSDIHTTDSTPTFFGTTEGNSIISLTIDGGVSQTVQVDDSGNWSIDVVNPLALGQHTYQITTSDIANNIHIINQDLFIDDPSLIP
ncbi:Ig-like domain-containing protein, partial [Vibrio metoecus]|uniref:Ig-like domain-containing protein n=1 Tax=Vibrio metoecus TaxID=1481663 RepID=UPI00215CE000